MNEWDFQPKQKYKINTKISSMFGGSKLLKSFSFYNNQKMMLKNNLNKNWKVENQQEENNID